MLFQKELSDFIFLTLKLHNRQYFVDGLNAMCLNNEEMLKPSKNGIIMDIKSWYQSQYKIFARHKISSFISNNTILILNFNNSVMRNQNLKYSSPIELSYNQL